MTNSNFIKQRRFSLVAAALVTPLLISCGDSKDTIDLIDGVFIDSAVQGLSYSSATQSGVTDANGGFTADRGQNIEFSIGDLKLPPVLAKETITPLDIFSATSVEDTRVANLARLLQSLDKDGNPDNGIEIDPNAAASATQVDFASPGFDTDVANLVANSGSVNVALVNEIAALEHLQSTLNTNSVTTGPCGTDHPLVGSTASFSTFFHEVAGNVTVIDNCTLEVTNFTYDGQGPRVFFYGGVDGAYSAATAFAMGPRLNGRPYSGDSITVKLPESRSLDDFNSISVWCADFDIDFGSAMLQ